MCCSEQRAETFEYEIEANAVFESRFSVGLLGLSRRRDCVSSLGSLSKHTKIEVTMSLKRTINKDAEKVIETYKSATEMPFDQQDAFRRAIRELNDACLCLVFVQDYDDSKVVLADRTFRALYQDRYFSGGEIKDIGELEYLESQVVPLDDQDLRKKLEEADRELDRVKRVLERQEQAAAELRRQLIEQGPVKTLTPIQDRLTVRPYPLSGQHELVQKSRSKS